MNWTRSVFFKGLVCYAGMLLYSSFLSVVVISWGISLDMNDAQFECELLPLYLQLYY